MMLRASTRHRRIDVDLRAIGTAGIDSLLPHGAELIEFSEAVLGTDTARLDGARARVASAIGDAAVSDAAAVAANFQMMDRIANGCGIALDAVYEKATRRFRGDLAMEGYPSRANTPNLG